MWSIIMTIMAGVMLASNVAAGQQSSTRWSGTLSPSGAAPAIDLDPAVRFETYWHANGGLPIFGKPISEVHSERNPDDGQLHPAQYFERAPFELHTTSLPRGDVKLGRLGVGRSSRGDPAA